MATYTSKLNLKKPAGTENINISDINGNMDIIDGAVVDLINMHYGSALPNGTDLNNATDIGFYTLSTSSTYGNMPDRTVYGLMVIKSSASATAIYQIAIGTEAIYVRIRTNSTNWTSWKPIDRYGYGWLESCDLDTVLTPGSYGLDSINTYQHIPTGVSSGLLEVIAVSTRDTYVWQRITNLSGIYVRWRSVSSGTSWGSWYKFTGTAV